MFNILLFILVGNICCNNSNKVSESKSIHFVGVGVSLGVACQVGLLLFSVQHILKACLKAWRKGKAESWGNTYTGSQYQSFSSFVVWRKGYRQT